MHRNHFRLLVDVVLLATAFLTFASGLVLFLRFHMGGGAFRTSALGLTRLAWLNLHRLPALLLVAVLGLHLILNGRAFRSRLRNGFARKSQARAVPELVLYGTFWTAALTGIVAWFFVSGSAPIEGPVPFGWLYPARHHVVEVHHIVALVALVLAVHHVGHRWHRMARGLESWVHCDDAAKQS